MFIARGEGHVDFATDAGVVKTCSERGKELETRLGGSVT